MQILENYKFKSKSGEVFVKDYSFNKFVKDFPEFSDLLLRMKTHLNNDHEYYLVDLIIKEHKKNQKTCVDVRYHVDGEYESNNQYCLWVSGPNRTLFPKEQFNLEGFPSSRNDQNNFLELFLKDKESFEVPEETFVLYSSKDPHKGVVCEKDGRRIFVRLMATDYIKPKNFIKKSFSQVR